MITGFVWFFNLLVNCSLFLGLCNSMIYKLEFGGIPEFFPKIWSSFFGMWVQIITSFQMVGVVIRTNFPDNPMKSRITICLYGKQDGSLYLDPVNCYCTRNVFHCFHKPLIKGLKKSVCNYFQGPSWCRNPNQPHLPLWTRPSRPSPRRSRTWGSKSRHSRTITPTRLIRIFNNSINSKKSTYNYFVIYRSGENRWSKSFNKL